ncbi:Uncharacterised protein [Vibrio cholerae]|nr:Uncharacterised protein [Vibrio cholerae]
MYATRQHHIDLVILHRLAILRVIHEDTRVAIRRSFFFNRLANNRHKVVIVFVDGKANGGICQSLCTKTHTSRKHC